MTVQPRRHWISSVCPNNQFRSRKHGIESAFARKLLGHYVGYSGNNPVVKCLTNARKITVFLSLESPRKMWLHKNCSWNLQREKFFVWERNFQD
ncbi:hypothetical protein AVEN_268744-1 [Araneus ventricosus]|uniref:Uncharacterized protein n=1 Tax=Araneus ventricosus TaxID=182803 RepID=A0A4Y2H3C1_ARAVE|nr:hypothetical protein AVEN_268744-1 [Araneus ventricosus]